MNVRPARLADVPAILEIYNEAVLNTAATWDYDPETLEQRAAWLQGQQAEGYPVLVAQTESGKVAGWGALSRFHPKKGYQYTAQNAVYVAPNCRRRGVGRALLAALLDTARAGTWHTVLALIDAENEASIRLHAAFGYTEVGRLREVGWKFDRWRDVVYLQYLCGQPDRSNTDPGKQCLVP